MQRWFVTLALACGAVGSASAQVQVQDPKPVQAQPAQIQIQVQAVQAAQVQIQPAVADRVALVPMMANVQPTNLAQADAIFVGRVVAIEPMDVEAAPAAGQANVKYRVAVIQVSESIFGLKKDTQNVRVAFIAQGGNVPPNGIGGVQILPAVQPNVQPLPGRPIRPFPGGFGQMNLTVGQDGMFAVTKHHKENFYLAGTFTNFISRENNPAFAPQVKTAKQLAKVMGNPAAALKADDNQDRYLAATILIGKYRNVSNPTGKPTKEVPIDAEESKLILKAIAGGDWKVGQNNGSIPIPFDLFNQLGFGPNQGYNIAKLRTLPERYQAAQKWLDENNGKHVINKFVVDPNAKAPAVQPGVQPGVIQPGVRPLPVQIQPLPAPVPPIQDLPIRNDR